MKKLNLIKRLLSYSHEKQSPQRFARYAAMLIMLLTLGVGRMWADWYISGWESLTGHDWGTNNDCKIVSNTVTFSEKGAAAYQFKLTNSSNWYGHNNFTGAYGAASRTSESGWDNAQLTTTWKSDITFTYDGNEDHNYSAYAVPVLYIAGNGTADSNGNWCDGKNWNPDSHLLSKTATAGKYTVTFEDVAAGDYQFKITDGTWSYILDQSKMSNSSPTNVTLTSSGNPDYNICFSLSGTADVTILVDITSGSAVSGWKVYVTVSYSGLSVAASPAAGGSPTISATSVNKGSSVTVTANADSKYNFAGWTSSGSGTFGNTSATSTTFTPAANDEVVTASYSPKSYSITYKDKGGSDYSGSNEASLPSSYTYGTGIASLTDGVKSGYRFDGWFDNSDCTGSAVTSISTTATGAKTFYAKWTENPGGTVTLTAGTGGQVSKDGSSWAANQYYTGIKTTDPLDIYAQANTGYTFSSWTRTSGTGTITSTTTDHTTYTPVANADATLTANFTERMSALTTSCHYDAGDPSYAAPTVSGSATNVGYVTTRTITATAAGTGYTFTGWTLTNCTRTDGGAPTATSITISSNGDGDAVSVVANYTEDLSSNWKILGGTNLTGDNWAEHAMTKKTGHSTESVAYYTFDISSTNSGIDGAAADWSFKIKNGENWYGMSADGESYWWTSSTTANQNLSSSGKNIQVCANVVGPYEVKVDYTTPASPKITITFPTSYTLTYSIGSVAGTDGSITTDPSTASGSKVLSGNTVTLTAPAAKTGYTWSGWYTDAAGTTGKIDDTDHRITVTMDADKDLYACYTEDSYTVTVNVNGGGKVSYNSGAASTSVNATAGVSTLSGTISTIPDPGYAFVNWTGVDADNHITAFNDKVGGDKGWNSTNEGFDIQVKADAATTITANFAPRFALMGSLTTGDENTGGLPGWSTPAYATYSAGTYTVSCDLTNPNSTYKFKIIDMRHESWVYRGYSIAENNLAVDNSTTYTLNSETSDVYFDSKGVGTYTFTIVEEEISSVVYPKVKIQDGANSHWITMGTTTFFNGGASSATATSSTAGGNVTAEDGEDTPNPIVNGNYIKDGGTITFTADPEDDGYTFEGWYTNEGCTTGKTTTNPLTVSSIDADVTRYAKFTENMTTVTLTATNGKIQYWTGSAWADAPSSESVGVHTTCSIKAVPNSGYYFAGWVKTEGSDYSITGSFESESNNNTTLSGKGGGSASGQTLTANFVELDKIYFRNIFDDGENEPTRWANVYVYFHTYWDDSKGAGANGSGRYYAQMTQIDETDVYWAYVPRAFTTMADATEKKKVGFADHDWHDQNNFRTGNAVNRGDYIHELNMYVPYHTSSGTKSYTDGSAYTTTYFSTGYWGIYDMVVGENVSYYLKNSENTEDLAQFEAAITGGNIFEATYYINNPNNDMEFRIVSGGGITYDAGGTKITSTNATAGVTMRDWNAAFTIHTSSEGNYTFRISQEGDQMKLTVDYPVSVGDYRIKHSYTNSGTKYAYSDIIKASDSHPTVSMFYDPEDATMVLQKCTTVTASGPLWNEGTPITMTKLNKGAGVYQFDLTISADAGTIDDGAGLYDGPFYIKTDCAPGGWAAYKYNPMSENTANPTAFDYYFINWIPLDKDKSETKNIKCVIANDYNNAISDTLRSDGIATMVGTEPILDNSASVRFSYNSKTNTLKRAYLTGASSLTLETFARDFIYNDGGSYDQYDSHPGFVDDVLWTYELTVDAKLGAKAGVRAVWVNKAGTRKEQTLIEKDNPIISGTGSGTYKMRLVFDFKTNSLISSWTPSGEIKDALSDVDVMLVREGQEASNVITFGTGGSLAPRKLVGSLKFEKTTYFGNVASWTPATRPLLTFFVSFPFDVKVNDVFGLNSAYGDAYVIRRYAGDERAAKGFFRGDGTTSFWKDLTTEDTMNAYEGYIVVLDNDYFNSDAYSLWGGKSELYLYFPSSKGGTISAGSKTIPVPAHPCGIDRTFDGGKNHMNTDSHWNLIGVPVFTTYDDGGRPDAGTPGAIFAETEGKADAFNYFYVWNSTGNDFTISSAKNYEFKAMHGYMVQYHGDVTFTGSVFTPASVAARRTVEKKNYDIELQVLNNEAEMLNRTYVALRDGASSEFVLNEDVYLSPNNRDAEIYTFAGEYDVAANRLPVENQLVQMGLNVHKAGNYTISMPSTFSGTVTLVDTYTNTRTNLAIDEYEVNLPQGTCEDRFLLELNIHKVPTAIDGVDGGSLKDGNAHKFIMNDRMYILKNGVIYDACGNRVQ